MVSTNATESNTKTEITYFGTSIARCCIALFLNWRSCFYFHKNYKSQKRIFTNINKSSSYLETLLPKSGHLSVEPLFPFPGSDAVDGRLSKSNPLPIDGLRLLLRNGTSPRTTPSKPTWPMCRMSFCGMLIMLGVILRDDGLRDALNDPVTMKRNVVRQLLISLMLSWIDFSSYWKVTSVLNLTTQYQEGVPTNYTLKSAGHSS